MQAELRVIASKSKKSASPSAVFIRKSGGSVPSI